MLVDEDDASKRVLRYVARLASGGSPVEIRLAHLVPRLPPALLETGGAEQPEREERIEAELRAEQQASSAASRRAANRVLRAARLALERAGVRGDRIRTCLSSPLDDGSTVDTVLSLAHHAGCRTIVIGHRAHGRLQGLAGGHLAEQLIRKADGQAVWVID